MINFQRYILPIISGFIFSQGLVLASGIYHVNWSTTIRVLCGIGIATFSMAIYLANQLLLWRAQKKDTETRLRILDEWGREAR